MAKAKKKLLPKDFDALLRDGDLEQLKAVFDQCQIDARRGYTKHTALACYDCPDDLARWLVEQGADIEARDTYGETPLHTRAGHWQGDIEVLLELGADVHARDSQNRTPLHSAARVGNVEGARLLLARGARADALDDRRLTPLALALAECNNARIKSAAAISALLLDVPAPRATGLRALAGRLLGGGDGKMPVTPDMKAAVQRIGTDFEFHRAGYNPEGIAATSAALDRLYELFGVSPVPRRVVHDSKTPIRAKAARWEDRHQELWALLVPSSGAAGTVQGEVIRISGRIGDEVDRNGGVKKMGEAFLRHIGSGVPLPDDERAGAARAVSEVRRRDGATGELCKLAVDWVALNPQPVALPTPDYSR